MKLPAAIFFSVISTLACAGNDHNRVIGSTLLAKAEGDRDVLEFSKCRADVSKIKLKVRRSNAEIETVVVRFANGEVEHVSVRQRFARGSESRWIDMPGYERCIRSITIVGDSEGSRKQAKIEVIAN
jgi:hypothetical protein